MYTLSELLDSPEPTLAVVIDRELPEEEIDEIASKVDVFEFRADLFNGIREPEYLKEQVRRLGILPVLVTVRSPLEGGMWGGRDDERVELLLDMLQMPEVGGIDVEVDSGLLRYVASAGRKIWKTVISSRHYFDRTPSPEEMAEVQRSAVEQGADYVKIATRVDTINELEVLEEFTANNKENRIITVGMGEYGPQSRIRLPLLGSRLTYAHNGHGEVASGQMDYRKTSALLKDASTE